MHGTITENYYVCLFTQKVKNIIKEFSSFY